MIEENFNEKHINIDRKEDDLSFLDLDFLTSEFEKIQGKLSEIASLYTNREVRIKKVKEFIEKEMPSKVEKLIKQVRQKNPKARLTLDEARLIVRRQHSKYLATLFPEEGISKDFHIQGSKFKSTQKPVIKTYPYRNCYDRWEKGLANFREHTLTDKDDNILIVYYHHASPISYEISNFELRILVAAGNFDQAQKDTDSERIAEIRLISPSKVGNKTDHQQTWETYLAAFLSNANPMVFFYGVNFFRMTPTSVVLGNENDFQTWMNTRAVNQLFEAVFSKLGLEITTNIEVKRNILKAKIGNLNLSMGEEATKSEFLQLLKEHHENEKAVLNTYKSYWDLNKTSQHPKSNPEITADIEAFLQLEQEELLLNYKHNGQLQAVLVRLLYKLDITPFTGCNDAKDRDGVISILVEANEVYKNIYGKYPDLNNSEEFELLQEIQIGVYLHSTPVEMAEMASWLLAAVGLENTWQILSGFHHLPNTSKNTFAGAFKELYGEVGYGKNILNIEDIRSRVESNITVLAKNENGHYDKNNFSLEETNNNIFEEFTGILIEKYEDMLDGEIINASVERIKQINELSVDIPIVLNDQNVQCESIYYKNTLMDYEGKKHNANYDPEIKEIIEVKIGTIPEEDYLVTHKITDVTIGGGVAVVGLGYAANNKPNEDKIIPVSIVKVPETFSSYRIENTQKDFVYAVEKNILSGDKGVDPMLGTTYEGIGFKKDSLGNIIISYVTVGDSSVIIYQNNKIYSNTTFHLEVEDVENEFKHYQIGFEESSRRIPKGPNLKRGIGCKEAKELVYQYTCNPYVEQISFRKDEINKSQNFVVLCSDGITDEIGEYLRTEKFIEKLNKKYDEIMNELIIKRDERTITVTFLVEHLLEDFKGELEKTKSFLKNSEKYNKLIQEIQESDKSIEEKIKAALEIVKKGILEIEKNYHYGKNCMTAEPQEVIETWIASFIVKSKEEGKNFDVITNEIASLCEESFVKKDNKSIQIIDLDAVEKTLTQEEILIAGVCDGHGFNMEKHNNVNIQSPAGYIALHGNEIFKIQLVKQQAYTQVTDFIIAYLRNNKIDDVINDLQDSLKEQFLLALDKVKANNDLAEMEKLVESHPKLYFKCLELAQVQNPNDEYFNIAISLWTEKFKFLESEKQRLNSISKKYNESEIIENYKDWNFKALKKDIRIKLDEVEKEIQVIVTLLEHHLSQSIIEEYLKEKIEFESKIQNRDAKLLLKEKIEKFISVTLKEEILLYLETKDDSLYQSINKKIIAELNRLLEFFVKIDEDKKIFEIEMPSGFYGKEVVAIDVTDVKAQGNTQSNFIEWQEINLRIEGCYKACKLVLTEIYTDRSSEVFDDAYHRALSLLEKAYKKYEPLFFNSLDKDRGDILRKFQKELVDVVAKFLSLDIAPELKHVEMAAKLLDRMILSLNFYERPWSDKSFTIVETKDNEIIKTYHVGSLTPLLGETGHKNFSQGNLTVTDHKNKNNNYTLTWRNILSKAASFVMAEVLPISTNGLSEEDSDDKLFIEKQNQLAWAHLCFEVFDWNQPIHDLNDEAYKELTQKFPNAAENRAKSLARYNILYNDLEQLRFKRSYLVILRETGCAHSNLQEEINSVEESIKEKKILVTQYKKSIDEYEARVWGSINHVCEALSSGIVSKLYENIENIYEKLKIKQSLNEKDKNKLLSYQLSLAIYHLIENRYLKLEYKYLIPALFALLCKLNHKQFSLNGLSDLDPSELAYIDGVLNFPQEDIAIFLDAIINNNSEEIEQSIERIKKQAEQWHTIHFVFEQMTLKDNTQLIQYSHENVIDNTQSGYVEAYRRQLRDKIKGNFPQIWRDLNKAIFIAEDEDNIDRKIEAYKKLEHTIIESFDKLSSMTKFFGSSEINFSKGNLLKFSQYMQAALEYKKLNGEYDQVEILIEILDDYLKIVDDPLLKKFKDVLERNMEAMIEDDLVGMKFLAYFSSMMEEEFLDKNKQIYSIESLIEGYREGGEFRYELATIAANCILAEVSDGEEWQIEWKKQAVQMFKWFGEIYRELEKEWRDQFVEILKALFNSEDCIEKREKAFKEFCKFLPFHLSNDLKNRKFEPKSLLYQISNKWVSRLSKATPEELLNLFVEFDKLELPVEFRKSIFISVLGDKQRIKNIKRDMFQLIEIKGMEIFTQRSENLSQAEREKLKEELLKLMDIIISCFDESTLLGGLMAKTVGLIKPDKKSCIKSQIYSGLDILFSQMLEAAAQNNCLGELVVKIYSMNYVPDEKLKSVKENKDFKNAIMEGFKNYCVNLINNDNLDEAVRAYELFNKSKLKEWYFSSGHYDNYFKAIYETVKNKKSDINLYIESARKQFEINANANIIIEIPNILYATLFYSGSNHCAKCLHYLYNEITPQAVKNSEKELDFWIQTLSLNKITLLLEKLKEQKKDIQLRKQQCNTPEARERFKEILEFIEKVYEFAEKRQKHLVENITEENNEKISNAFAELNKAALDLDADKFIKAIESVLKVIPDKFTQRCLKEALWSSMCSGDDEKIKEFLHIVENIFNIRLEFRNEEFVNYLKAIKNFEDKENIKKIPLESFLYLLNFTRILNAKADEFIAHMFGGSTDKVIEWADYFKRYLERLKDESLDACIKYLCDAVNLNTIVGGIFAFRYENRKGWFKTEALTYEQLNTWLMGAFIKYAEYKKISVGAAILEFKDHLYPDYFMADLKAKYREEILGYMQNLSDNPDKLEDVRDILEEIDEKPDSALAKLFEKNKEQLEDIRTKLPKKILNKKKTGGISPPSSEEEYPKIIEIYKAKEKLPKYYSQGNKNVSWKPEPSNKIEENKVNNEGNILRDGKGNVIMQINI